MGRVTVVGAGVIGLSCALRLLEAGHRVDVLARELPRETTSAVAAAIWYPYRAWPQERVLAWSRTSYDVFAAMAAEEPDSGVVLREGTEVVARPSELTREKPWWADAVPDLHETLDVPAGYDGGWAFTAPVVEMPVYLDWLAARVLAAGGSITRLNLHGLPRPGDGGPDAVVDCSGLGAKFLAADPSLHPVQGQVVLVEQVGLERWWLESVPTRGRRTSSRARATSSSVAPTSRVSGAGRPRRTWPRRSCGGRCGWSPRWRART